MNQRTRSTRTLALAVGVSGMLLSGCALDTKPGAESIITAFSGPTVAEAAEWSVDKYDADKRYRGTLILSNQPFAGDDLYLKLFLDNINDEDARVRSASVRAIANHGKPEQAQLLITKLKDVEAMVRKEAARGLQRLSSTDAIDPLIEISREPDVDRKDSGGEAEEAVRVEAVDALGQFPNDKVVQALVQSLADTRLAVNRSAHNSLRTLTGQDFGLDRRAWLDWYKDTKDPFKARALYTYNVFSRGYKWWEYIPFVPKPPNETTSIPNGMILPGVK